MSVAKMIKGHELFSALSFEEVEAVSGFSALAEYQPGDNVYRRGGFGSHLFVLVKGRLSLLLPSADEESSLCIGRLDRGEIFGLAPLLGFERYTTTARITEPSSVLAIEVLQLRKVFEANPRLGMRVMNLAARAYYSRYLDLLHRVQGILNEMAVPA